MLKTGDTAVVLSGKEKGKRGKVLSVNPKKGMVVIEGVNMVTCHTKPRRQGETGGIVEREGAAACLQGHEGLPEVRQADSSCSQDSDNGAKLCVCKHCGVKFKRGGCNKSLRILKVSMTAEARPALMKKFEYESVYADPEARQDRHQRRLR